MGAGAPSVAVAVGASVDAMQRFVVPVSTSRRVSEIWRVRTHGWIEIELVGG